MLQTAAKIALGVVAVVALVVLILPSTWNDKS